MSSSALARLTNSLDLSTYWLDFIDILSYFFLQPLRMNMMAGSHNRYMRYVILEHCAASCLSLNMIFGLCALLPLSGGGWHNPYYAGSSVHAEDAAWCCWRYCLFLSHSVWNFFFLVSMNMIFLHSFVKVCFNCFLWRMI